MSLLDRDYQKICALCENAQKLCGGNGSFLCRRHGVVAAEYSCRRFSFDPLKRIPLPRPVFQGLSDMDEEPQEELSQLLTDTYDEEEDLRRKDASLHFAPGLGKERL